MSKQLAAKIKQARRQAGYSQKEMGVLLELSDKAISAYESGRAEPSLDKIQEMSRITNQPVTYFFQGGGSSEAELLSDNVAKLETSLATMRAEMKELKSALIEELRALKSSLQ